MVTFGKVVSRFLRGCRRTAVFALTTNCNCKCIMCDMHRKTPEAIRLEDAEKVLEFLAENKFLVAYFTGGEPTLHPDVVEIVNHANRLGLVTAMTTNGTVDKTLLKDLRNAGLYNLSVSIDHWDADVCEKIRGHRGIMAKQVETIRYAREIGIRTYALAFLNPFLVEDGVDKLIDYVNSLGVPFGFCHPTKTGVNSYGLGGVLSEEEMYHKMKDCVETILSSKKNGRNMANLYTYIEDILSFYEKKSPNFYCKGGEDVFYIDWLGDVYPCFLKPKLFNILNGEAPKFLKRVKCNDCLINCFREPSFIPNASRSPILAAKEIVHSYNTRQLYK